MKIHLIHFVERTSNECFRYQFFAKFLQNSEITKASIKLNHYKIRIRKLLGQNLRLSFIAIFTVESEAFSLTSGFHAETLITLLRVITSRHFFLLRLHRK